MKLRQAIDIAKFCGLSSLEEAITNIELHWQQLLPVSEATKEMSELYEDLLKIVHPRLKEGENYSDISIDRVNLWIKNSKK